MATKKRVVRRRLSQIIGARVHLDTDADVLKWWNGLPDGQRSSELLKAVRARMRGGGGEGERLKHLEGEVARLVEMVQLIGQMLESGVVVAQRGIVQAPTDEGMTDEQARALEESMAGQW